MLGLLWILSPRHLSNKPDQRVRGSMERRPRQGLETNHESSGYPRRKRREETANCPNVRPILLATLNNLRHFLDLGCYKDLLTIAELAVRLAGTPSFSRITQLKDADIELKIMAAQLLKDEELLDKEPKAGISLCAKWAPSDNAHFNAKPLRFAQKITKTLGVTKKQYRQKLTKLRAHLNVLETLMCGNLWDQIVFQQLPAKAHRMYRCTFNREVNKNKHSSGARKASFARYVGSGGLRSERDRF